MISNSAQRQAWRYFISWTKMQLTFRGGKLAAIRCRGLVLIKLNRNGCLRNMLEQHGAWVNVSSWLKIQENQEAFSRRPATGPYGHTGLLNVMQQPGQQTNLSNIYTNKQHIHFNIYDVFYSNVLTNMFRPVFWPSSGWCHYYKNTKLHNVVNYMAVTL
jgi:hypothetical protein